MTLGNRYLLPLQAFSLFELVKKDKERGERGRVDQKPLGVAKAVFPQPTPSSRLRAAHNRIISTLTNGEEREEFKRRKTSECIRDGRQRGGRLCGRLMVLGPLCLSPERFSAY